MSELAKASVEFVRLQKQRDLLEKRAKKVLREEFKEEKAEEEAEGELAGKGAERKSSVTKKSTSLPRDGEEDINEGIS